MKRTALVIIFVLIFCEIAFSSGERFDGYFWEKLDYHRKHTYVLGYIEGLSHADSVFHSAALGNTNERFLIIVDPYANTAKDGLKWMSREEFNKIVSPCSSHVSNYIGLWVRNLLKKSGIRQIVDGVDSFYSDYRNKRILVKQVLLFVGDDLNGWMPKDRLQEVIDYIRKNPLIPTH